MTTCKTIAYQGDSTCASTTESGGIFPPNGTVEIDCYCEVPDDCDFERVVITVDGRDNNGYSFSKSMTLYFESDGISKIK